MEKEVEMGLTESQLMGPWPCHLLQDALRPSSALRVASLWHPEGAKTACSPWRKWAGMEVSQSLRLHTTRIFPGLLKFPSPLLMALKEVLSVGCLRLLVCLAARCPDVSVWSALPF